MGTMPASSRIPARARALSRTQPIETAEEGRQAQDRSTAVKNGKQMASVIRMLSRAAGQLCQRMRAETSVCASLDRSRKVAAY
jgi:hypothetical protein